MTIRIIVAGATGWTGSAVAKGVLDADDMVLVGAVSRAAAGKDVGEVLGRDPTLFRELVPEGILEGHVSVRARTHEDPDRQVHEGRIVHCRKLEPE